MRHRSDPTTIRNLAGEVLWAGDASSHRDAIARAAAAGANVVGANFDRATILESGETLQQCLAVPALLTAGGRTVAECAAHWGCHSWDNCPMAAAFGVTSIDGVPPLHRPRVEQFVRLFDAGLIPCPEVTA